MSWWHNAETLQADYPLLPKITAADGPSEVDIVRVDAMLNQVAQEHKLSPYKWAAFNELTLYGFARLAGWSRFETEAVVRRGHAPFLVRDSSTKDTCAVYIRLPTQIPVQMGMQSHNEILTITRQSNLRDGVSFSISHANVTTTFASPIDAMLAAFSVRNIHGVLRGVIEFHIWFRLRPQMAAVCIALQPLDLPALVTLAIVDELFKRSSLFTMALKWRVITTIKHHHSQERC
jgi:hypothetical protein